MIFYRIAHTDPPTTADVTSAQALGIPLPTEADAETERLHDGISVYATEAQALRKARGVPRLGRYVAELDIPEDGSVRWERTTNSNGHYTLWGDPALLARCVVSVTLVIR